MRAAIVALTTVVALLTTVMAQPRKVLVLPLDGNAPGAQRTKLDENIASLAKLRLGASVTVGDTTFNETAAAVGCSPSDATCAEQVRTTLAVDELIYGTATTADGSTTVTVLRAQAGSDPKTQISVIPETDSGDAATATIEPLFTASSTGSAAGSDVLGSGAGSQVEPEKPRQGFFSTKESKLGLGIGGGGVILFVVGLSLWASASSIQDDIDNHPTQTLAQINDLKALEDRAGDKALQGNIFVVLGLAATGVGAYFLWKDRKNRRAAALAPAPVDNGTGMTFVLRGSW